MKKVLFLFSALLLIATIFSSCGPYKTPKYKNVGTNQTAFVIPMEVGTQTGQKMLKSVEFLDQKKVSSKRIYIEQKKIENGYMPGSYDYIPTDTVVIVDRSPVTREWIDIKGVTSSGTTHGPALNVESKESIGFVIPVNSTCTVQEEDAATFLYWYGGQDIGYVMDHNVRPFILDIFTKEFGKLTLDNCQEHRNDVYDTMKNRTIKFFKQYGLTIINLGVAGEYTYTDIKIQEAINTKFTSEMKIVAAHNEAAAAKEFDAAAESIKKQKDLDADVNLKNSLAQAVREGKFKMPENLTIVGNTSGVFDLVGIRNMNGPVKK